MMTNSDNLRNACQSAVEVFAKLKQDQYSDIQSKLEYCIGSYDNDKNPSGLYEYGKVALKALEAFKADNPRKVSKKIIEDLSKNLNS